MGSEVAICFPGQGTQYVGMGRSILEGFDRAEEVFSKCEEVVGLPVKEIMLNGPIEELTRTEVLQPALTALEISLFLALKEEGIQPSACAGHSLGEYPALYAAGILGLEDCFSLVSKRGAFMEEASLKRPGAMAAVIGLERPQIEEAVDSASTLGVISLANYNSPEQIIITGEKNAIKHASKLLKDMGARVIPLKVAGGYHSELMAEAAEKFRMAVDGVEFKRPILTYYSNVTGLPEQEPSVIRDLLVDQIKSPVLWYPIIKNMFDAGIKVFIEIGPKKVLTNLIKKSLPLDQVQTYQFEDIEGLKAVCKALKKF